MIAKEGNKLMAIEHDNFI